MSKVSEWLDEYRYLLATVEEKLLLEAVKTDTKEKIQDLKNLSVYIVPLLKSARDDYYRGIGAIWVKDNIEKINRMLLQFDKE